MVRSVVAAFVMLAGGFFREDVDDVWSRKQAEKETEMTSPLPADSESPSDLGLAVANVGDDDAADGAWDIACVRSQGGNLTFDRGSIRELGDKTLFRWSAAGGPPRLSEPVYTAVVDCRSKTIEASWPGKRSDTRAGTCGRHLVDAVCAATPRAHSRIRTSHRN